MKIVIKSAEVSAKNVISKRTGKPYTFREQTAFLTDGEEVRRFYVTLQDGQNPYAPGEYVLSSESFRVTPYGALEIGRLLLMPVPQRKVA